MGPPRARLLQSSRSPGIFPNPKWTSFPHPSLSSPREEQLTPCPSPSFHSYLLLRLHLAVLNKSCRRQAGECLRCYRTHSTRSSFSINTSPGCSSVPSTCLQIPEEQKREDEFFWAITYFAVSHPQTQRAQPAPAPAFQPARLENKAFRAFSIHSDKRPGHEKGTESTLKRKKRQKEKCQSRRGLRRDSCGCDSFAS